jgi:hypothetical protein
MATLTSNIYGFLSSDDITDGVLRQPITATTQDSRVQTWLNRTESELISIAQIQGVPPAAFGSNFKNNGLHYKVKEYAIAYYCFICSQDLWTITNVDPTTEEKYKQKMLWYQERFKQLRPTLTREMIIWPTAALFPVNRAGVGNIWRA